jgi:hypothetical protein
MEVTRIFDSLVVVFEVSKIGLKSNFHAEENWVSCVHKPASLISCKRQESRLRLSFARKDQSVPFSAPRALVDYFTSNVHFSFLRMAPSHFRRGSPKSICMCQNGGR